MKYYRFHKKKFEFREFISLKGPDSKYTLSCKVYAKARQKTTSFNFCGLAVISIIFHCFFLFAFLEFYINDKIDRARKESYAGNAQKNS